MRKELYDFLQTLPRGARTDMGREFFLYVYTILTGRADWCSRGTEPWRKDLGKLRKGDYFIHFPEEEETDET